MIQLANHPMFNPGRIVATPAALQAIEESNEAPSDFLLRHIKGDWGIVNADDKLANDQSLIDGSRLLSAYETKLGVKIWLITEAEDGHGKRVATTILLPEEY